MQKMHIANSDKLVAVTDCIQRSGSEGLDSSADC